LNITNPGFQSGKFINLALNGYIITFNQVW